MITYYIIYIIRLFLFISLAWNAFYAVLKRKGTKYKLNGFLDSLRIYAQERFPLPSGYNEVFTKSLEPFSKQ